MSTLREGGSAVKWPSKLRNVNDGRRHGRVAMVKRWWLVGKQVEKGRVASGKEGRAGMGRRNMHKCRWSDMVVDYRVCSFLYGRHG